ncbi:MAG: glucose-6-phosphate isomerase [Puniceicoccales bacterium]|jgi:glucose-6-phosphate isomerase|nr:glucose-6-phosphate isomerase [Puniceicoccales bacterium]
MDRDFFRKYFWNEQLGIGVDLGRIRNYSSTYTDLEQKITKAFNAMAALESGGIANPSENRMVGHYWLRNPGLAPTVEIKSEIENSITQIERFAQAVHKGDIVGQDGRFENILCLGIGGSALGPRLISSALTEPIKDKMKLYFIDNTDPDGIDYVAKVLDGKLGKTLVIVMSKSGGTQETKNAMLEVEHLYYNHKITFSRQAVAVTCKDSKLDRQSRADGWLSRFPMWDWVGGRTSVTSVVGLLPAALQGLDFKKFLAGARDMDSLTRRPGPDNLAMVLAVAWYSASQGQGKKDMVVIPYKDRLSLFTSYLQQLIMESLGKRNDINGLEVHQGISVYGNKGSTDQHAYVQQLRDGLDNFFVTFIEVLKSRVGESIDIEPGVKTGDYLEGFLLGTRLALSESGRESITLTIREVNAYYMGILIALYERAVGFYASLIDVNAYDQPGVEAGKKAANEVLHTQQLLLESLSSKPTPMTSEEIAKAIDADNELVFKLLEYLAANDRVVRESTGDIRSIKYMAKVGN